jgi:hypothetical protein
MRLTAGGFGQKISGRTSDTFACLAQPLMARQIAVMNPTKQIYRRVL